MQLILQAEFGNLERGVAISAVDNYTGAGGEGGGGRQRVRVSTCMYVYVIASESGSGIRVPSPSRNVYLEINGELLLDRVQPRRKYCIFGPAGPSLSTVNDILANINGAILVVIPRSSDSQTNRSLFAMRIYEMCGVRPL